MRVLLVFLALSASALSQQPRPTPIIDVHLHAFSPAEFGPDLGPTCGDNTHPVVPAWDPKTPFSPSTFIACTGRRIPPAKSDDELMRQSLAELKRHDFRAAVASGPLEIVSRWRAASDRVIPAISFFNGTDDHGRPRLRPLDELRQLVKDKKVQVFAEVGPQYRGMAPADPALDPYFALAEELDIPVGLHMGEGPPGGPNFPSYEKYRVAMGDPLLLEPLLTKHPKLRLYVMHYGSPFVDNMIAILYSYPQVYVDIACNDWGFPRKQFHDALRRLVDAGFEKRIMFGSDQMVWPGTISLAVETVDAAPFLNAEQKRDIFCRNAARFLRLGEAACN
jgi:uncharacterized protein